jgi:hypothetical protein
LKRPLRPGRGVFPRGNGRVRDGEVIFLKEIKNKFTTSLLTHLEHVYVDQRL